MDIKAYTDGSAHPASGLGAWACIFFNGNSKTSFKGIEKNTTHQRMELIAVIKALDNTTQILDYKLNTNPNITIFSDSQYVVGLQNRKDKILHQNYKTKRGADIRNADLVKVLYNYDDQISISFVKVKAHQKAGNGSDMNREVDKMCRQLLRDTMKFDYRSSV